METKLSQLTNSRSLSRQYIQLFYQDSHTCHHSLPSREGKADQSGFLRYTLIHHWLQGQCSERERKRLKIFLGFPGRTQILKKVLELMEGIKPSLMWKCLIQAAIILCTVHVKGTAECYAD